MATNFPNSLDTFVRPTSGESLATGPHSVYHDNALDAIEALEAKVGVDGSSAVSSLDYLIKTATDPGHTHTDVSSHESKVDPHSIASYGILIGGGRRLYVQAASPTTPVNGDIWFDTSTP